MMKKIWFVVFVSLFLNTIVTSQETVEQKTRNNYNERNFYGIGLSYSAFLSEFSGIQISQYGKISQKTMINLETAYLFNSTFHTNAKTNGLRLKVGIDFVKNNFLVGIYLNYRYTNEKVPYQVTLNNFRYFNKYDINRNLLAFMSFVGLKVHIDNTFLIFKFGLGVGYYGREDIYPNQLTPDNDFKFFDFEYRVESGKQFIVPISFNMSFCYTLWQDSEVKGRKKKRKKRKKKK